MLGKIFALGCFILMAMFIFLGLAGEMRVAQSISGVITFLGFGVFYWILGVVKDSLETIEKSTEALLQASAEQGRCIIALLEKMDSRKTLEVVEADVPPAID